MGLMSRICRSDQGMRRDESAATQGGYVSGMSRRLREETTCHSQGLLLLLETGYGVAVYFLCYINPLRFPSCMIPFFTQPLVCYSIQSVTSSPSPALYPVLFGISRDDIRFLSVPVQLIWSTRLVQCVPRSPPSHPLQGRSGQAALLSSDS